VLDETAEKVEPHQQSGPQALLSPREREVMQMTSQGLTNLQIAEQLTVTVHAVKFHLASIYRKLGVSNRTEAAVAFLQAAGGSEDRTH
jgi:DNA-binding NarL/FixJ family response regulator